MQKLDAVRRERETRWLKVLLGALAITTAGLGLLLYPTLDFGTLLLPFAVFAVVCGLVLPLDGHDRQVREAAARVEAERRKAAARHAMDEARRSTAGEARTSGFHRAAAEAEAEAFARTQRAMEGASAHGIHFASGHLQDEEFYRSFVAGELRAEDFRHGDHLRFAWLTLERLPLAMVEESVAGALRTFLRRISGSTAAFHATHTHGWVAVLASFPERSFAEALSAHTAALEGGALLRYWSAAVLGSDAARGAVAVPDVAALPLPAGRRVRRYRQGHTSLPAAPYAPVVRR